MKFLMYSHDSYGLGHLRRTLTLAEAFVERDPRTNVLILTGSPVPGAFRMPRGVETVKLPSAVKVANGHYEPRRMSVSFEMLKELRSGLILSATRSFRPDAFVVDKTPLGMKREVLPTLRFLHDSRADTLTVLGLRDVLDAPDLIRRHWKSGGIDEAIEAFYDLLLVYGPREVYDPLPEYGLSEAVIERSRYVGYVSRRPGHERTFHPPFRPGYVLVTAGGGGDGFRLIEAYLEGLRASRPSFESVVITGPLMDGAHKRRVESLSRGLRARILEFSTDMERLICAAGAVVSMGGYNTTIELLAAGKQAVIVPRVEPRLEQLIRTERLSALGLVEMIHPNDLAPDLLLRKVGELLERGSPSRATVDLSGAQRAVELVLAGVNERHALPLGSRP
jgi:predicted glycosyltransferase